MRHAMRNPLDRFWEKVRKTESCWLWTAYRMPNGYGQFGRGGRTAGMAYAHRYSWELVHGPIPQGMTIDHLCGVRHCVNPAHMEVVTRGENSLRGNSSAAQNARKTHCKRGHSLHDCMVTPRGFRQCRICNRLKSHFFFTTGHSIIPERVA